MGPLPLFLENLNFQGVGNNTVHAEASTPKESNQTSLHIGNRPNPIELILSFYQAPLPLFLENLNFQSG